MKRLLPLLLILLSFYNCNNPSFSEDSLYNFISEDDKVVLKINNHKEFITAIEKNTLLNNLNDFKFIDTLNATLKTLKDISPTSSSLLTINTDNSYTFITKFSDKIFVTDSSDFDKEIHYEKLKNTISEINIDQKRFQSTAIDSVLILSNSIASLDSRIKNTIAKNEIKDLFYSLDNSKSFSAVIKSDKLDYLNICDSTSIDSKNYYALDFDLSKNHFYSSGVITSMDSTLSIIDIFKNTQAQENKIINVSPKDIDYLKSLTFSNIENFRANLNSVFKRETIADSIVTYFDYINEIGTIRSKSKEAIIMTSLDPELTQESFFESSLVEPYKDIEIFQLKSTTLFSNWFYPLITKQVSMYCRLDSYFVFTNDIDFLKSIITSYLNDNTLAKDYSFSALEAQLNDESSLLILSNADHFNSSLNTIFNDSQNISLTKNKLSAFQFVYENNYAHVNIAIKESSSKSTPKGIRELHNITLDADLLTTPQFVINHRTRQKEIVVQDINNVLYLISNSGTILWKKKLNGPILGKIEQIDTYRNGRLQLAFTTPNRLYVLDRNGNNVNAFPLKFRDNITQPLSVFDYDKRKDYRLLVTQGSQLLMYDKNGKSISGFKFNSNGNAISSQPEHFRLGSKDYIVFKQGNQLQILNRVGKTRVKTQNGVNFSDNPVYVHQSKFTTTTTNGTLYQVNARGKVSETNLNLNQEHKITASSKTLVSLNDNILKIKSHTVELPYGSYTNPKFFYLQDKIYVSVTDLQTKKVYLFDSLAKVISNFPVYGNSSITLDNIDKDSSLEFVVKGDLNSLILYEMN